MNAIAQLIASLFEGLVTVIKTRAAAKAAGELAQGQEQVKAVDADLATIEGELKRAGATGR